MFSSVDVDIFLLAYTRTKKFRNRKLRKIMSQPHMKSALLNAKRDSSCEKCRVSFHIGKVRPWIKVYKDLNLFTYYQLIWG